MSLWLLLGFGWFGICIVLAVMSMSKGFLSFITWIVFGGALMAFHLQMHDTEFAGISNMKKANFVMLLFSVLMWFGVFYFTMKKSIQQDP